MSDSSSEDEISKELLESVDKSFMNNSLFSSDKHNASSSVKLPSLRIVSNDDDQFTDTGIKKSTQTFIAKRLSKVLDSRLEEVCKENKRLKCVAKKVKRVTGGVSLFSDSVEFLDVDDSNDNATGINERRKSYVGFELSEAELENRCKATAVSPDWILTGASMKGWSKNTKGKVIRVKPKNSKTSLYNVIECEIIK